MSCSAGGVFPFDSAQPTVWQSLQPPTSVRYRPAAESLGARTRGTSDVVEYDAGDALVCAVLEELAMQPTRSAESAMAHAADG